VVSRLSRPSAALAPTRSRRQAEAASSTPARRGRRPADRRSVCKREQGLALQRRWLAELAWNRTGTAAQVQLWLGVFPVNWRQLPDVGLLERQISTIRRSLGGGYGQLLRAMVLDPTLQISLNRPANHRRQPNENLARELLELFALGEGIPASRRAWATGSAVRGSWCWIRAGTIRG
jgi:uncharacterized protein (DUF1800 family)